MLPRRVFVPLAVGVIISAEGHWREAPALSRRQSKVGGNALRHHRRGEAAFASNC
jgi:hypothetical protein